MDDIVRRAIAEYDSAQRDFDCWEYKCEQRQREQQEREQKQEQHRREQRNVREWLANSGPVYETRETSPQPAEQQTNDQARWAQWDAWCDDRIWAALETFAEIIGSEIGETEKALRDEVATLRADLEFTRSLLNGKVGCLPKRRADDAA